MDSHIDVDEHRRKRYANMANQSHQIPGQNIICSRCGHSNPAWYAACEKCNERISLVNSGQAPVSRKKAEERIRRRPGCVTAYAIILALAGSLFVIYGLVIGLVGTSDLAEIPLEGTIIICTYLGIAGFQYILAYGLWNLKNWARIIIIIIQGLSVILSILSTTILASFGYTRTLGENIIGIIVSLLVSGYILYWFVINEIYFR